jgi:hypothetical protein
MQIILVCRSQSRAQQKISMLTKPISKIALRLHLIPRIENPIKYSFVLEEQFILT